jgi:hypothetical protein
MSPDFINQVLLSNIFNGAVARDTNVFFERPAMN